MSFRASTLALATVPFFALPALAHHSFAVFDLTKTNTVAGTVKELEWINPHVWFHVVVAKDDGTTQTLSFEAGSPAQLSGLGWKPDNIHPGDKVDVGYHPMKDGSSGGQLLSLKPQIGGRVCSNRGCD